MKTSLTLISGLTFLLSATLPAVAAGGESDRSWKLEPRTPAVQLSGFMGSLDLSGIAMTGKNVLVVSDELTGVQGGTLDEKSGTITYTSAVSLALTGGKGGKKKGGGKSGGEIDMEGACFAPEENAFYVTGSHGVGKKKGDVQLLRYGVYRIPYDAARGGLIPGEVTQTTLLPVLEQNAIFKDHLRQPLQQNGFNIEGLAWAGGKLFFGVRGPNIGGDSFVIEVPAGELFAKSGIGVEPRVHRIPAGAGKGIREIVSVKGGFLMLTGNAASEASKAFPESLAREEDAGFALSFVPRQANGDLGKPEVIGDVTQSGGKAEGLLVMKDEGGVIEIAVLHDGLEQGGATSFAIRRPANQVVTGQE